MSPAKTSSRKASPSRRGEAARAEKKDTAKVVDFLGLKLKLPAKLPGTILFDLADLESGNDLRGTMEFIKSLVGSDQYQAIRNKVAEKEIELDKVDGVLLKLLEDILEASGLNQGE